MHIYWRDGGLTLWPDTVAEREALALLSSGSWTVGRPHLADGGLTPQPSTGAPLPATSPSSRRPA
jgi:hypothetical protein